MERLTSYPLTLHVQGHLTAVREVALGVYHSKRNEYRAAPDATGQLVYTHAAKLPKQIYTVRHGDRLWTYGSSAAMLADPANPLTIDRNRLAYLARRGWPVASDECQVWRGPLLLHQVKPA